MTSPAAFSPVFDRHYDPIHRYLRARAGADRAEDLASETFVRAFAGRARFRPDAIDARPWLFGIATNLLRENRRAQQRRLRAYARSHAEGPADPAVDDLVARLDALAQGRKLAALLLELGDDDRELLLLVAIAGLSGPEAAESLGIPTGTVASRLSRLRARLRPLLENGGNA